MPPSEKAAARQLVERVTPQVRAGGGDVVVRINRPIQLAVRDIEHSVVEGVDGLAITKVDSAYSSGRRRSAFRRGDAVSTVRRRVEK